MVKLNSKQETKICSYILGTARIQVAKQWKDKEEPSVEDCLIKLQELILMDKLTDSLKGKSRTEHESQRVKVKSYLREKWKKDSKLVPSDLGLN